MQNLKAVFRLVVLSLFLVVISSLVLGQEEAENETPALSSADSCEGLDSHLKCLSEEIENLKSELSTLKEENKQLKEQLVEIEPLTEKVEALENVVCGGECNVN